MERRHSGSDRRRQSFTSIWYGNLRPRREANRRVADDQVYLVDVYDAGLIMVCLAIVLMCCLDAFFTLQLIAFGAEEINYFMDTLMQRDVDTFLNVKLAATCTGVVFLTVMSRYRIAGLLPVRRVLEAICAIYACLIIWELYLLVAVAATLAR